MYENYRELKVSHDDKILVIKFNNPKKKNSLNPFAYEEITNCLNDAGNDESVVLVVFTGEGEYFTSGNDLSLEKVETDYETRVIDSDKIFRAMITAIIDCPKVLVALVNGPAIGIGATLASLCDLVWCSKTAYFSSPFTKLGLVPEGCSSFTWPLLLGKSKASELLLFSEKMTAEEAYHFNFASKLFEPTESDVIWLKLHAFSKLPSQSLSISKKLMRHHERDTLLAVLNIECNELLKRLHSDEFLTAVASFASRKIKSKL